MGNSLSLFGASGRLGKEIARLASHQLDWTLQEAIVHPHSAALGQDLGTFLGEKPSGLRFQESPEKKVDVAIDVSLPPGFGERLDWALETKTPFVIGTTQLGEENLKKIEQASHSIPILYAPNFSLAMALLKKLALQTAELLQEADIDLIEVHHTLKKDAPSGSALLLQRAIEDQFKKAVPIHSLRSGTIIGEHTLLFNAPDELSTLSHKAHSRLSFAKGALRAARFLLNQTKGLYKIEDLF